jgi:hypothetical protein
MVDQNINPEEFDGGLGPFETGTTNVNAFLPFQGNTPSYNPIVTPSPVDKVIPGNNLDNQIYPVKDYITGLPPYTDNSNKAGKMTARQKSAAIASHTYNLLNAFEDNTTYAKVESYDPSSNGAHRAKYLAYGQETFDKVGFNPLINNEALFNKHTDTLDDFARTFTSSFFPLLGRGIIANPKSYAGLFTGDFGQDIEEAKAYDEYHAIGYSSKGGVGAFINNTLNSFAYTAGILIEAAAEEALIGAAIGSRGGAGGGAMGGAIGGTAGALKGLFQVPRALASMTKNGAKIMTNLRNLDNISEARAAFNSAAKTVGNFLNPVENITNALRSDNILTGSSNLGKLARSKNTFAGFYLDVRNMNMALSEARLEGGFVENNTYKKLYDEHYSKFGEAPDNEKQKEFRKIAKQAGADSLMYNSFLIFYSNKLVFPTIMRGSLLKNMANYGETIVNVGKKSKVVFGKAGFEAVDVNLKTALKALKNPLTYGRSAAGYFKANVFEGLQENFQDVIADYTEKRYTEAYYEPAKMTYDFKKGLLKDALLKQISPEGFETFASGFVMGGYSKVLTGGYNLLSENYAKYIKDPKGYQDALEQRKETAQSIADRLNKVYSNPKDFFNSRYFNYGHQVLVSKVQDSEDVTQKEMMDTTDDSFITNLSTILRTNTMDYYIDNLQKMKQLAPEEIEKELDLAPGEGQKAIARIDTIINRARRMEKRYNAAMKMQSGIDLNDFKEGTDEYRKAAILDEAFAIARANLVFMGESFDRNLERIQSISNDVLNLVNKSDKIAASDITALVSESRLTNEINMLQTELETLEGVSDPKAQAQLRLTEDKIKNLREIKEAIAALDPNEFALKVSNELLQGLDEETTEAEVKEILEKNFAETGGKIAKEIVEDIKTKVVDYLKTITGGTNEYNILMSKLSSDEGINSLDSLVTALIDLHKLDAENSAMSSGMTILSDPDEFLEHVNRNFKWMNEMYLNRKEYFKDVVNTSIEQKEYNDLLQRLADKGIYVDLDEFAAWIEDKRNLPTQFEDSINKRIVTPDTPLYREYIQMFMELADIQQEKPAGEKANVDELLRDRLQEEDVKMQKELDDAKKTYDQELKAEVGYTEKEIQEISTEEVDVSAQQEQLSALSELIENIESLGLNEPNDTVIQQEYISKALEFSITPQEIEAKTNEHITDEELRKAAINLSKKDSDINLLNTPEGKIFIFQRTAVPDLLKVKTEALQKEIEAAQASKVDIDIEATAAKKKYNETVAAITEKYNTIKEEIVAEFNKKGAKAPDAASAKAYTKITTETPWDDLPADLKSKLQKEFDKYKKEKYPRENDESVLNILKQNWLKTQGAAIEAYNTAKLGEEDTDEILVSEPPILTFADVSKDDLITKNLSELTAVLTSLQKVAKEKKKYDAKKKALKALTKKELDTLDNEIKALSAYISYRRSIAEITTPEDEVLQVIESLIKDGSENVEIIKDKSGRTIGRRIKGIDYEEGEYATRVTSEKERILRETDPGFEPYVYAALKPQVTIDLSTGKTIEGPSKIEEMVKRVEILNFATEKEKVENFIDQLKKAYSEGKIKKFGVEWKYQAVREYFLGAEPKSFNYDNVKEIIGELANKESSETGTAIDSLSRDYLAGKKITKPQKMSEKAFKNLKETLDIVLDKVKDGKLTVVPKDIILYDKDYVSEDGKKGITGEIDLLLIDENKNFYIVDFKTGHSGVWTNFNKQPQTIDLTEAYTWSEKERPKLTDMEAIDWMDATGYESFDEFNAAYSNEISSISVISTEGANKTGEIKGTIKVFFEKGSGKKAVNLEVKFVKPNYTIVPEFSRRPEYATQLTFYRNLFYKMTGIMPKEIRILPIQTKINEEAQIESLQLASIADPKTGFITVEPVEKVNELVPITGAPKPTSPIGVTTTTSDTTYEEYKPKSYDISKNVNKTVLYQGQVGTIVEYPHSTGMYAIDTPEGLYPIDTTVNKNILKLGISTITLNPQMFNQPVIDEVTYEVLPVMQENAPVKDKYTVNGIEYTVQRNAKGGIKSLQFRKNDSEIIKRTEEIKETNDKLSELQAKYDSLSTEDKQMQGIQIMQQIAGLELKLDFLNKKLGDLANNNSLVISKDKTIIAAIQSLPETFTNSTSSEEEEEDLDEIKKRSVNSSAVQDMYDIMLENYPEKFDMLITDPSALTGEDLSRFDTYLKDVISKLEDLKSKYEAQDSLVDNITTEIAVLMQLMNHIKSLNLNKNGRVSKTQKSATRQEQERLQQDVSKSLVQEPEPGSTEQVSGRKVKQTRGTKVNNEVLQPLIFKLLVETTPVETEEETSVITIDEIEAMFNNATADTLDEVYFDVLQKIKNGEINLPNTNFVDKLYKQKEKEYSTTVSAKNVNINDYLLSKKDSALFRVTDVVEEGVEVINDSTEESMFISNADLKSKYLKHFKKYMGEEIEEPEVFDESDVAASEETGQNTEDATEDQEAINEKLQEFSELSKEERRNRLRNNSKC